MHIKYTKESKDQKRYLLGPNIKVKLDCGWNNRSWITKRLSLIQNSERNQKVNIYRLLVKGSPSLRLANKHQLLKNDVWNIWRKKPLSRSNNNVYFQHVLPAGRQFGISLVWNRGFNCFNLTCRYLKANGLV